MRKKLLGSQFTPKQRSHHFSFFDLFSVSQAQTFLLTCPLYTDCKPNMKENALQKKVLTRLVIRTGSHWNILILLLIKSIFLSI